MTRGLGRKTKQQQTKQQKETPVYLSSHKVRGNFIALQWPEQTYHFLMGLEKLPHQREHHDKAGLEEKPTEKWPNSLRSGEIS